MAADIYVKRNNLYIKGKELFRARKLDKALKLITKSADIGNGTAMYFLAYLYKNGYADGIYIPSDKEKAFYWMKKAADEGFSGTVYDCAELDPDKNNWIYWMEKGAKMGNKHAAYDAACYYQDPDGEGHRDLEKAFHLFGIGAEKGHQKCLYEYAQMYRYGIGTPKDPEMALFWMRKASSKSDSGFPDAGYEYAKMLYTGEGCTRDLEEAWDNMSDVAVWYDFKDSKDLEKEYHFAYQQELAESGDDDEKTSAWYKVGCCYEEGKGTEQDYAKAAYWYEKAAKHVYVYPNLMKLIYYPQSVKKERRQEIVTSHIFDDEVNAQIKLANMYLEGRGVKQDYIKAYYWLKMAEIIKNEDADSKAESIIQTAWNLNKESVDEIFEDCIANEYGFDYSKDDTFDWVSEVSVPGWNGGDRCTVRISRIKCYIYSDIIDYFFGLLGMFWRDKMELMFLEDDCLDHNHKEWAKDHETIVRLYALGISNSSISYFYEVEDGTVVAKKNPDIIPSLYVYEPEYSIWLENTYKYRLIRKNYFNTFRSMYTIVEGKKVDPSSTTLPIKIDQFWYQPPESRERIIKEIQEKLKGIDRFLEGDKKEKYEYLGSLLAKAKTYDTLFIHTGDFSDEHLRSLTIGEGFDDFLLKMDQIKLQKENAKTNMKEDSETLLEIAKEAFHITE